MELGDESVNKIINDPISGLIVLDEVALQIIDTDEFQRLRNIKQLGFVYYIFPGASHNRFEHCIGTYHLAGILVNHLQTTQPELNITEKDVKCVKLAGLCHDLGHGPFSHFFSFYLEVINSSLDWTHERCSEQVLDYIVSKYSNVDISPDEVVFIKDLIHGAPRSEYPESKKLYLFEIVSNKRNSIDVDKLDYLQRDCYNIGVKYSVDVMRLIKLSRVIDNQICFNYKEAFNIYQIFHTRYILFKLAYTHRVSQSIELMTIDAMKLADEEYNISRSIEKVEDFTRLTDSILERIVHDDKCKDACDILKRISRRQLYKFVDQIILSSQEKKNAAKYFTPESLASFASSNRESLLSDICVLWRRLDYSMAETNPLTLIRFYTKSAPGTSFPMPKNQLSLILPNVFEEISLRIFVRSKDMYPQAKIAVKNAFTKYLNDYPESEIRKYIPE